MKKLLTWIDRQLALGLNRPVSRRIDGITARFHVNSKDEYKVVVGGLSERDLRSAVTQAIRPDDVIVEIGAHIGSWSVYLAQHVPRGELHVFEPVPTNYSKLAANIALNKLANVTTYATALGESPGEASFFVPDTDAPVVGSLHDHAMSRNKITVEVDSLDHAAEAMDRAPTFLKIDCEGAEAMVLRGAERVLSESVRGIFIEVHRPLLEKQGEDADAMIDALVRQGFEIKQHWGDGSVGRHLLMIKPDQG